MKEKLKIYGAIALLFMLIPYMITLFFHGEGMGLFREKSTPDTALEERVLQLVSEEISGQAKLEAIKAQAVIARTELTVNPDMEVVGNDTNLLENMESLKFCVEETCGEILTYEGEPIWPEYHAVSGKYTRNGAEVAGQEDKLYLKSVESVYDIYSPDYLVVFYMEKAELAGKMQELIQEAQVDAKQSEEMAAESGTTQDHAATEVINDSSATDTTVISVNAESILEDLIIEERDSAEYVTKVRHGDIVLNGEAVREKLGLSSSLFYLTELKGKVRVMTKGLGHGLGLSQYGANAMAAEGKDYEEILKYYYSGVEIEKMKKTSSEESGEESEEESGEESGEENGEEIEK